jgi:hypothetical protein
MQMVAPRHCSHFSCCHGKIAILERQSFNGLSRAITVPFVKWLIISPRPAAPSSRRRFFATIIPRLMQNAIATWRANSSALKTNLAPANFRTFRNLRQTTRMPHPGQISEPVRIQQDARIHNSGTCPAKGIVRRRERNPNNRDVSRDRANKIS